MSTQPEQQPIVLHRTAPWNPSLRRGGAHAYAQIGDRKFHANGTGGVYIIIEVDDDGDVLGWEAARTPTGLDREKYNEIYDRCYVGLAFNRGGARIAIQQYLAGKTPAEVADAVRAYGHPGTGRNSRANVARRRGQ